MTTAEIAVRDRSDLIKGLALAGIVGSALFAASGVWSMISPTTSADGNQILQPTQFQITGGMLVLAYAGWLATALAFYLRGAMGSGWLGKIAVAMMAVGLPLIIADQITRIMTVQNTDLAPWQGIAFVGAIFIAPILLGVAALRAKVIPLWMALYPILMVAVVPFALWGLSNIFGAGLVIFLQGLLWLGFAVIVYMGRVRA